MVEHTEASLDQAKLGHLQYIAEQFSKPNLLDEMDQRVHKGLQAWEKAVVRKYFKRGGTVLNIGCGAGRESIHLAKLGFRVVAVDVCAEQLALAEENARQEGVEIQCLLTDGIHLPTGPFDAITAWAQVLGNIERVEDQVNLLASCKEALAPAGIVSASGHHRENCRQASPHATDDCWLYPWTPDQLRYHLFTPESFAQLFEQAGLHVVEVDTPRSLPVILHAVARYPA